MLINCNLLAVLQNAYSTPKRWRRICEVPWGSAPVCCGYFIMQPKVVYWLFWQLRLCSILHFIIELP